MNVTKKRYSVDPSRMFDISLTDVIYRLAMMPIDGRPSDWTDQLLGSLWNASVEIPETPYFRGPDGFPYLRLQIPRPGSAFNSNCLSRQAQMLVSNTKGAALFHSAAATNPTYVLPMGVIDSMLRFDSHQGDPIDVTEAQAMPSRIGQREIRIGSDSLISIPSREYLPSSSAKALYLHLTEGWQIADPRIVMITIPTAAPTRWLIIDQTEQEIGVGNTEIAIEPLLWYLPPLRAISPRPQALKVEKMARLADYIK